MKSNVIVNLARVVRVAFSTTKTCRFYSTVDPHPYLDPSQKQEMMDHKMILVDENDKVLGSESKLNCHYIKEGKLLLHRAFSVLMFTSKNELVLQQRSAKKACFPNYMTNACCSHPLYDESVHSQNMTEAIQATKEDAVERLRLELGISRAHVTSADLQFVNRILYKSLGDNVWGEHELDYIFVLRKDVSMRPNPMEIERVWTVARNDFDDFYKHRKQPVTPWFDLIIKNWLYKIWDNLDDLKKIRDENTVVNYTFDTTQEYGPRS